jgi:hypothetical protein
MVIFVLFLMCCGVVNAQPENFVERMKQVIHEHKEKELSKKYWGEING